MKELGFIAGNTTSFVGYIALLIVAGSYMGGDPGLQTSMLKSSIMEHGSTDRSMSGPVIVTINGRQYLAEIRWEVTGAY